MDLGGFSDFGNNIKSMLNVVSKVREATWDSLMENSACN